MSNSSNFEWFKGVLTDTIKDAFGVEGERHNGDYVDGYGVRTQIGAVEQHAKVHVPIVPPADATENTLLYDVQVVDLQDALRNRMNIVGTATQTFVLDENGTARWVTSNEQGDY